MNSDANKEVVRRLGQVVNSGNLDQLDEILSPDYIRHDPNPLMKDIGREEYKEAFRKLKQAFPDAQWTLQDLLSDGDKVIGRWTFSGTHEGQFFNLPPSGEEVVYPILAVNRIEDGIDN